MSHAEAEIKRRSAVPAEIEEAGPRGDAAREQVGRLTYEINVQQYACAGLNFGAYYDASPIIAYDGVAQPSYTMSSYAPSTVPGCRTPHFFRDDGSSLYDGMGPEFTLLRLDGDLDVTAFAAAAEAKRVPLKILNVRPPATAGFNGGRLILSRPDQHVAWRGEEVPVDPGALIERIRGAAI
jgi:hypothetical protein